MLSYDSPVPIAGNSAPVDMTNMPTGPNQTAQPTAPGIPSASADGAISPRDATTKKAHHIWLVTGPAGVGKSSVAAFLAEALGFPYIEGDEVRIATHGPPFSHRRS